MTRRPINTHAISTPARPRFPSSSATALIRGINARVLTLDAALREAKLAGIEELVPTYRSLMIHYEPLTISRADLVKALESLALQGASAFASKARWHVPCCYEPALAEDIIEAAQNLDMPPDRLAASHASGCYRAYMYGFAPGWCYLGGLPESLALPRRASPRGATPPGAVLIGGGLSLIISQSDADRLVCDRPDAGADVRAGARAAAADRTRRRRLFRTH